MPPTPSFVLKRLRDDLKETQLQLKEAKEEIMSQKKIINRIERSPQSHLPPSPVLVITDLKNQLAACKTEKEKNEMELKTLTLELKRANLSIDRAMRGPKHDSADIGTRELLDRVKVLEEEKKELLAEVRNLSSVSKIQDSELTRLAAEEPDDGPLSAKTLFRDRQFLESELKRLKAERSTTEKQLKQQSQSLARFKLQMEKLIQYVAGDDVQDNRVDFIRTLKAGATSPTSRKVVEETEAAFEGVGVDTMPLAAFSIMEKRIHHLQSRLEDNELVLKTFGEEQDQRMKQQDVAEKVRTSEIRQLKAKLAEETKLRKQSEIVAENSLKEFLEKEKELKLEIIRLKKIGSKV